MDHVTRESGAIREVAMLGNHIPRQCGIATFTSDLSNAIATERPDLDCFVLAMNDVGARHEYPARVRFELAEGDLASYRRAADFLNLSGVDVLSVQHEYGIFGGKAGSHVLSMLRELRMPVVTTLHTILATPSQDQRAVMDELTYPKPRSTSSRMGYPRYRLPVAARSSLASSASPSCSPSGCSPPTRASSTSSTLCRRS
jgi:hypothetical protein